MPTKIQYHGKIPPCMSGMDSPMVLFTHPNALPLTFCENGGFGANFGFPGSSFVLL